jgi:hypothetical protein
MFTSAGGGKLELMFQSTSGSDFLRLQILEVISDEPTVEAMVKTPEFYRGVRTALSLRADNFSYEATNNVYVGEYLAFAKELSAVYETLSGSARLLGSDWPFSLNLMANATGHILLSGEILDLKGYNKLSFGFEMDQTGLVPITAALRKFIAIAAPVSVPG